MKLHEYHEKMTALVKIFFYNVINQIDSTKGVQFIGKDSILYFKGVQYRKTYNANYDNLYQQYYI